MIFMCWTALFAMQFNSLGSNSADALGYSGVLAPIGYFFVAFENGLGNIAPPTVDIWM